MDAAMVSRVPAVCVAGAWNLAVLGRIILVLYLRRRGEALNFVVVVLVVSRVQRNVRCGGRVKSSRDEGDGCSAGYVL